ncbi:sulfatase-like hydrolase/transferase [Enterococcus sp.]|uniref:sulfatase-like hydrolase/transferase n=1 Tax=Enterococcus sp. TaxID=35783 RepID=UPI002FC9C108
MKKNILFILTDDQRFDTIAALGNPEIHTPNLDTLVANGTSFLQAHIPGATNGAVCMPSRGMIHSSQNLFKLESCGANIPESHPLLGETLKENGYQTAGIGKWHNGIASFARSFTTGADIFFGGMWDHWNVPTYAFDNTGRYEERIPFTQDPFSQNKMIHLPANQITLGMHSTDLFTQSALQLLDTFQTSADPFFLYLSYLAPHDPRTMPEKYQTMYDAESLTLPENFCELPTFHFGVENERGERLEPYPRDATSIKQHIADYYAMISHLDENIGKIITRLKENQQFENTLIVFAGDNGLALGQHSLMSKQNLYDHSIRIPLILAGPGIPKNETRTQYVYLMDIFPTLCDLFDLPCPQSVDGISFLPTIKENTITRPTLFSAFCEKIRSLKMNGYKLIEYRNANLKYTQLFDLANDPFEVNNLSNEPEQQECLFTMRKTLIQEAQQWGDFETDFGQTFWHFWE